MSSSKKRGAFIVIEGLDRSGKSTQAATLVERLQAERIAVQLHKFPDRTTPIGRMIDSYLRSESDLDDHTVHLLFSANRWELATSIEETLNAGTTILCDRYAFSGIAFSASKGLPFEWCRAPDVSLPAPDLVLFLDITPEKAKERGGYGEERYEKEETQRKVRQVFARMAEETIAQYEKNNHSRWVTVDAGQTLEAVTADIWKAVEPFVGGVSGPIPRLWEGINQP
ncbi:thymidylate kinase [Dentipellis sp. KUC8613]|nr:thymidylate kinase [Dentipellis sp. KUC8613]